MSYRFMNFGMGDDSLGGDMEHNPPQNLTPLQHSTNGIHRHSAIFGGMW